MENERYNYIVLDSVGSTYTLADKTSKWNVPNHFYTEYQTGDEIFMTKSLVFWHNPPHYLPKRDY